MVGCMADAWLDAHTAFGSQRRTSTAMPGNREKLDVRECDTVTTR
jgi:hypothetical protein